MANAAVSVNRYIGFFQQKQVRSVLDYGAGTLRNACFLADAGFHVYAADIPAQVERIMAMASSRQLAGVLSTTELDESRLEVDLVVSSYVFNIIFDGTEKSRYIKNIAVNLRPEGYLLIEARCRGQAVKCTSSCSSKYKCAHCIKTYSHSELDDMLVPCGFKRISHYYRRHAVAVLYQNT